MSDLQRLMHRCQETLPNLMASKVVYGWKHEGPKRRKVGVLDLQTPRGSLTVAWRAGEGFYINGEHVADTVEATLLRVRILLG